MKTFDDKTDDATHAAFTALGLRVEDYPKTADTLHDAIAGLFGAIEARDKPIAR